MNDINSLIDLLAGMSDGQVEAVAKRVEDLNDGKKWIPNPGPQTEAYFSLADQLLYGGEPGGGKSQLLLGLAFNEHQQSLIMRRKYGDLSQLLKDAVQIHGTTKGVNQSAPPLIQITPTKFIDFDAAQYVGDEQKRMGKGRDFIGIDEATHFAESQVRFVLGWLRSADPNQRTRVVLATNPPLSAEGLWVVEMFAPWIDPKYPNPAKPGELRWFISDEDGKDQWVEGPGNYVVNGKTVEALSRTYIPAKVTDNPYYVASGYQKQLDAMPEPYRSLLLGGFQTSFKDADFQVIPTAWVQAAQQRWRPKVPLIDGMPIPMCTIGVDCSGGSEDPMIIAPRHDAWWAELQVIPAKEIPEDTSGAHCAGLIIKAREDEAHIIIDMGGGYGGSTYEHLKKIPVDVEKYLGAEATTRRSRDGKFKFHNKRSAALWAMRELLDPGQPGGSPCQLPPDNQLLADLTAPTYEIDGNGITVESKKKVCERLGRSTDKGDAVMMGWWSGRKLMNSASEWLDQAQTRKRLRGHPQVLAGRRAPLTGPNRRQR